MKTLCILLTLVSVLSFPVRAANRYWVAMTPSNWNAAGNWSATSGGSGGAGVPTSVDAVFFDNLGIGNCTIDAVVSILSITVNSTYTGAILQGANVMTIGSTATFSGGTFTGGSANITVVGVFTLSGTAFQSTSATLELRDNAAFTSGTFTHNNGTVKYNPTPGTQTISGTSPTFYILEFVGLGRTFALSSAGSIIVTNSLNLSGALFYNINTGSIDVRGNINVTNTATGCGGDAIITINGTGSQSFSGAAAAGNGALPKLVINKSSGTLSLSNFPAVSNDFTYTAGTVSVGSSTFCFTRGNAANYTITGSLTLNNITFTANSSGVTVAVATGTTLTANGNLGIGGVGFVIINGGTINVRGDIVLTNTSSAGGGTTTINITGTSGQTIDGTAIASNQSRLPVITINKTGLGVLSFSGNISLAGNVTYNTGLMSAGTASIYIVTPLTITGSFTVYNLIIATTGTANITIASGTTTTVANDFTLGGGSSIVSINTGTIEVYGNINITNTATGGGGTGTILIDGLGVQTIMSTGVINQGRLPNVTISKLLGVLNFPTIMTVVGNWTYVGGLLNTVGSTVVFNNTLTITGSHILSNVEFEGTGNFVYTIASGTTLVVDGSMAITGTGNVALNTGTINLLGDLNLTNTGTGGGGTAVIGFVSLTNQAIKGSLTIDQSRLPGITINKLLGTLTFPSLITVRGNWTYTAGTIDVATNNSTIVFANSLTISGNHTLNNIGFDGSGNYTFTLTGTTLTATGNMTMSGTAAAPNNNISLTGGTINLNGNLILTNTGTAGGGTTIINFNSTANQSIISALTINQCNLPAVTINKGGGTLTLPSIFTVRGNWTYTAGTVDAVTNNTTVAFNNTLTFTGSQTLNNVHLEGNNNNTYTVNTGTVITVTGTLTTSGTQNVFISTPVAAATAFQAQGDIIINNTSSASGGTGTILINGTGAQAFTGNASATFGKLGYIRIQKATGTLSLSGTITVSRDWTYTSGTVDAGTSTIVFGGNNLSIASVGMSFYAVSIPSNTITLTSSLTATGDVAITGSGVLTPVANTINIRGNWSNYGTAGFVRGTSTVNFNGTTAQSISNSGGETFYNLIANNTSATGITLNNNATVTNALTLTNGKIYTTSAALLIINNAATATSGSATSFVDGPMRKIGNQAFVFPLGNGTVWARLGISAPALTTNSFTAEYRAAPYGVATTMATTPTPVLNNASVLEYWVLDRTSGAASVRVTLYWESSTRSKISVFTSDLVVAHLNGTTWENMGQNSISGGTSGSVTSNLVSTFSPFTFGSLTGANPLPIELLYFNADAHDDGVSLTWRTASEVNNDYFELERSADGKNFMLLGNVEGNGTTSKQQVYAFDDTNPIEGLGYYRLKQVDYDGKSAYFKTLAVFSFRKRETQFEVYPNPVVGVLVYFNEKSNFIVLNSNNEIVLQIYDTDTLDVSSLASGVYVVRNEEGEYVRFVKI